MSRAVMTLCGLAMLACAVWTGAGCGGPPQRAPRFSASDAVVLVQTNVPDAELWVDERFVAPVSALDGGMALPPGTHRIEVRHPLYHTFYETLTVRARERSTVDARLVPVLE